MRTIQCLSSLIFILVSCQAFGAETVQYVDVNIKVTSSGNTLLTHRGVSKVGSYVRAIKIPAISGEAAARIDYRVIEVGVSNDNIPIAKIQGTAYSSSKDDTWVVQKEFLVAIHLGQQSSVTIKRKSGIDATVEIKIDSIDEQTIAAKSRGTIPKSSTCFDAPNPSAITPETSGDAA